MEELDRTDKAVLNAILEDSRLSYRKIAKTAKVSVATVMHRIKALEEKGIIKKYTAALDYEKLGYEFNIMIQVRVSKGKLFMVESKIASNPNVHAVYDVTGSFDAIVVAKFRNRKAMDSFIKLIQTYDFVERTETMLILNELKEAPINIS
jgi:DNA-binding Lrp family transcriptional regulator